MFWCKEIDFNDRPHFGCTSNILVAPAMQLTHSQHTMVWTQYAPFLDWPNNISGLAQGFH